MRTRVISLSLVVLAVVAGCRADKSEPPAQAGQPAGTQTPAAAPAATVTVTASDFAFEAPSEVPAGLTTFKLVNRGPSLHHVQLVRLEEGKTADDFMAALKAGGPPPKWAVMAGGPNPPETGGTATTTLSLEPGNYVMVCFVPTPEGVPHLAKGMVRPLTVAPAAGTAASEPQADVVMKLVDYDFELSQPLTPGHHVIRVENAGPQEHEVAIVKLGPGKEPLQFAEWGERQVGPAPGTMHGGVSAIMPGTHAYVEVDLEPGTYGLVCFVPDMKDGKSHYHHGMVKKIEVR